MITNDRHSAKPAAGKPGPGQAVHLAGSAVLLL